MALDRHGIPLAVLNGKVPKYISVYKAYRARLMQQFMLRLNRSFWARAKRGVDDLGNTWKPLAPSTHAYKPLSPIEKGTYAIDGKRNRGLLTPAEDRLWKAIFARTLARLEKNGSSNPKKEAAEKAWAILKARGARTLIGLGRITDTNIRTGALVASTRPGSVANHRYYVIKGQEIRPGSLTVKLTLPYVNEVDKVRPIIPDNAGKWVREAHDIAIVEAKAVYERIQSASTNSRKQPKSKPSNRRKKR